MKKIIFNKLSVKILIVIIISYVLIKIFTPVIFLANTPLVNPEFITKLKNTPQTIVQIPGKMLASLNSLNPFNRNPSVPSSTPSDQLASANQVTPPPNIIMKSISKGVYAGKDPATGQSYIKIEAGTKYRVTGTVIIDGKEYPKIEFIE